ncbi:protein WVD2-like 7 isoform X2 [Aristolochia californica]|uniref:protein WVD2-like 7 isoform X2 n=1 Tax=Aristolochia californica TaxID=171875 RepID=UPI0035DD290E
MAAETEDPVSFQVDYLPTGSISFGRFEAESLDWGRRSSFSHNRYLDEVEKCSKPGSVIEKKAYFEAHFKRKALLRQVSSKSQSGTEYQSCENDMMDPLNYNQEYKNSKEKTFHPYYEETLGGSDDLEYEMVECETVEEIWPNEFQMDSFDSDDDPVLELDIQHMEPSESNQKHFECEICSLDNFQSKHVDETIGNDAEILKAKEKPKVESESSGSIKTAENELKKESGDVDELFEGADTSLKIDRTEKDETSSIGEEKHSLHEVKTMAEQKTTKTKVKAQVPVVQMNRKLSNEMASPSKESNHGPRKMKSALRIKTEKQTQLKVSKGHLSKEPQPKDSGNITAKPSQEKRSTLGGIDMKEKAVSSLPLATSGKSETQGCLPASRSKQSTSSKKTATKPSATGFTFKSNERAEKRKEFNSRLEEKMHAKEVEMNQIQARTQEEAEAEIKQFRRSLNFKATPMPSFYHEAGSQGSDSNKPAINAKSPLLPNKSTSHANKTRIQENQTSSSRNQKRIPSCKSSAGTEHATNCPEAVGSEAEARSPTQPGHEITEFRKMKEVAVGGARAKAEKKERDKSGKVQQAVGGREESALGRRKSAGAGKGRKGMVGGTSGQRGALAVGVVAS